MYDSQLLSGTPRIHSALLCFASMPVNKLVWEFWIISNISTTLD